MKKRSGATLLFVVPALALGACGGDSDKDKITSLIKDVNNDAVKLCDNATKDVLKLAGGKAGCVKTARRAPKQSEVRVQSVDVNGDKASAKVSAKVKGKGTKSQKVKLVKEDGDWKIDL